MTSFHPLSYNTDRNQDTGRGRQRMDKDKIEHLLKKYSFWEHLSEKEREMLQEQVRWNTYEEGQLVTDTGRDCLGIILVCKGILRANLVSEDGKEATVCRIHAGELCVISASCLLPALPFDIQIDAETVSEVYLIPTSVLREITEKNLYLENFIYKRINCHRKNPFRQSGAASCRFSSG